MAPECVLVCGQLPSAEPYLETAQSSLHPDSISLSSTSIILPSLPVPQIITLYHVFRLNLLSVYFPLVMIPVHFILRNGLQVGNFVIYLFLNICTHTPGL
jgi:hypothetical protein